MHVYSHACMQVGHFLIVDEEINNQSSKLWDMTLYAVAFHANKMIFYIPIYMKHVI